MGDLEAEAYQVDSLKELFALAEEDWGLDQVEFVEEIGLEVLADGGSARRRCGRLFRWRRIWRVLARGEFLR